MTYFFNPSHRNYRQLKELFEKLGNDYSISWDDGQREDGSYIYDIVVNFRKVGSSEMTENTQTENEKSLSRCLDQAMDNAAEFLSFIRMKDLEEEFGRFQEALVEHERLKKLFKEKIDD